jgi:methionyl aminopeptidase
MTIETPQDLQGLLAIGRIVAQTLDYMRRQLRPGMTTKELDDLARQFLDQHQARSAPALTYNFPGTTCISINDQATHGIPGERQIKAGDIVKLDVAAERNGYYADAAITVAVPPVARVHQRLCACAEAALRAGIAAAQVGQPLSAIGRAAEGIARRYGYSIVRELHGHGVGRGLHEAPKLIPQYYTPSASQRLTEGLVLTVEPHIAAGSSRVVDHADGWTISTRDRSPVAMYEHTIIVTSHQPIVVTAAARAPRQA